jgi:hypothetical protein
MIQPNASALVEFYAGRGTDARGRSIDHIWTMSLDDLELTHDYIQWLFPLRDPSSVEPQAPTLDEATISELQSPSMRERIVRSAETMAAFYGFQIRREADAWRLDPAPNAEERQRVWLRRGNHNFLRLTRIMKSLATLGLGLLSQAWFDALHDVYQRRGSVIGPETLRYWTSAPRG